MAKSVLALASPLPLRSVHGQTIPDTHKCILLTWTQDNYLAPFPCGSKNAKENLYFLKYSFYGVFAWCDKNIVILL